MGFEGRAIKRNSVGGRFSIADLTKVSIKHGGGRDCLLSGFSKLCRMSMVSRRWCPKTAMARTASKRGGGSDELFTKISKDSEALSGFVSKVALSGFVSEVISQLNNGCDRTVQTSE